MAIDRRREVVRELLEAKGLACGCAQWGPWPGWIWIDGWDVVGGCNLDDNTADALIDFFRLSPLWIRALLDGHVPQKVTKDFARMLRRQDSTRWSIEASEHCIEYIFTAVLELTTHFAFTERRLLGMLSRFRHLSHCTCHREDVNT